MNFQIDIAAPHQIDARRWDECIQKSLSPLIYARLDYLNYCCDNWSAIVINGYELVMPIPWRKKLGLRYCYSVPFIQQLGYFSNGGSGFSSVCLSALKRFCRYGDYAFNYSNNIQGTLKNNFLIDLSKNYSTIAGRYRTDVRKTVEKAMTAGFVYRPAEPVEVIETYVDHYADRTPHVSTRDYKNFENLCKRLESSGSAIARKVETDSGESISMVLLLSDNGRLYNMMNCTTDAGRKQSANYFLYDRIFEEFSGRQLWFDFEGSDLEGVKTFYKKFGGILQPYPAVHINELPFPLSKIKP